MKVLIIGGVAAGTKTAAKLRRADPSAEVTIIAKDPSISYAGCALPYYVGGVVENEASLIVNTPEKFSALTGAQVLTAREAVRLDAAQKCVLANNLLTGEQEKYDYDELVIAVGASAAVPPVEGIQTNGVFTLRTPGDAVAVRSYADAHAVKKAVVIGGSFIGLEAADNLLEKGLSVTVIDSAPQIMPGALDPEMAGYVQRHLQKKGIRVLTGTKAEKITGAERVNAVKTENGTLPAELVIVAVGISPNTAFLNDAGLEMVKGAIVVDGQLRTNLAHVYAVGDCAMVKNRLTGKAQWSPMGSSANLEGRTLAQILAGSDKEYKGVLGTAIVKLPGLNCGRTGLGEKQAAEAGYDVVTALAVTDDKAHYYPGAASFITKLIADRATHRLLGAQVLGAGTVDKMIDIAVTGLNLNATLEDFENADYAYSPAFSTAIHPFVQAVYILMNKLSGDLVSITPAEYAAGKAKGYRVIDASPVPSIPGATHVNLTKVNGEIEGIGKDEKLLLVCRRARQAYLLQNRMRRFGYANTLVLEGATTFNEVRVENAAVSYENVLRVKALGFLRDKRTADRFNCRVITRNGKITAEESRAIAEAAEKFGTGEIAMTSRLTVEIQGVPYDNVDAIRDYLAGYGLETGGTGPKVRPVVSCKGTTCQYGLIDTFALSDEIHERFYEGYHGVVLPHKFKIAVGGCPNNCVKPDLNDLGVIGQRVPEILEDKCRGCKVCQIEKLCPIKVAQVADGRVVIDEKACNHCGRCVDKCPFGALTAGVQSGYRVYIGGRWGKKVAQGRYLDKVFTDKDEVLDVIEKAILLFKDQGIAGERFADTVARLGFENVQAQLLDGTLSERKGEILAAAAPVRSGESC